LLLLLPFLLGVRGVDFVCFYDWEEGQHSPSNFPLQHPCDFVTAAVPAVQQLFYPSNFQLTL
jgi:hypothetical protein